MAKKVAVSKVAEQHVAAQADDATTAPVKKAPVKKAAPAAVAQTAPVKKAAVKAAPAAAAPAKKVPPKKAPTTNEAGETLRLQAFNVLAANPDGLTGAQIMEALGKPGEPCYSFIKSEGCREVPRVKRVAVEGVRGVTYQLTPAGKAALKAGTIDSEAAESATGKDWPA